MAHPNLREELYRYRAINKFSIAELVENKFYFASPATFNDPFECKNIHTFVDLPDNEVIVLLGRYLEMVFPDFAQKDKEYWLQHLVSDNESNRRLTRLSDFESYVFSRLEDYGVLCLSTSNDDILMWSHYADSHKGMCLIFDGDIITRHFDCHRVMYKREYPKFKDCINLRSRRLNLKPLILTKSRHWSYEREVRLLVEPEAVLEYTERRLLPMPTNALTGVIFGCDTTAEDRSIIRDVLKQNNSVRFYTARKSTTGFNLFVDPEFKIVAWKQLSELPYGVSLPHVVRHRASSITPTPTEVADRYQKMLSPDDVVVWATGRYCGIKIGEHELVWSPEQVFLSRIVFVTPDSSSLSGTLNLVYKRKTEILLELEEPFHQFHRNVAILWLERFVSTIEKLFLVRVTVPWRRQKGGLPLWE